MKGIFERISAGNPNDFINESIEIFFKKFQIELLQINLKKFLEKFLNSWKKDQKKPLEKFLNETLVD